MARVSKFALGKFPQFLGLAVLLLALVTTITVAQNRQSFRSNASDYSQSATIKAYPESVLLGQKVTVTWYNARPNGNDWIGLYEVNSPSNTPIAKKSTKECSGYSIQSSGLQTSGNCVFSMNQKGLFLFKLYSSALLATSNTVEVKDTLPIVSKAPTPTYYKAPTAYPTKALSPTYSILR